MYITNGTNFLVRYGYNDFKRHGQATSLIQIYVTDCYQVFPVLNTSVVDHGHSLKGAYLF
jgi:hypothetical protein